MGVHGVFEIIREMWHSHPKLCVKALQSFLGLLQGQAPSGLKYEPKEFTGKPMCILSKSLLIFLAAVCNVIKNLKASRD